MKKHYLIAEGLLFVLFAGGFFLACINEESSTRLLVTVIFGATVLLAGFPAGRISRRMIETGDSLKKGFKRVLFYFGMLVLTTGLCVIAYWLVSENVLYGNTPETLGSAILKLIFLAVAIVIIFLPFLLTMIVLVLRKFIPVSDEKEEPDEDDVSEEDKDE